MNILLVDDHAVVREGYKALLNAMMPECTVLEAADGSKLIVYLKRTISTPWFWILILRKRVAYCSPLTF